MLLERFQWVDWGKAGTAQKIDLTGDWVERFLDWKAETLQQASLKEHYIAYTKFLPSTKPLTAALLIDTCRSITKPNTHARKNCAQTFRQLGGYAGLEVDWKGIAGNYTTPDFDPSKLPSDEQIEENWSKRTTKMAQWVYGTLATYGLRPHEIYHLDCSRLADDGVLLVLSNTKTGRRPVYPCKAGWVEQFKLADTYPPHAKPGVSNKDLGGRIGKLFRNHKVGHIPYGLRHAYAIRLARLGVHMGIAAKWMGHSVALHTSTYYGAMSEREYKEEWEKFVKLG
ncbi:MAG: site-specific integrase [Cyanobacteria bacterium P01_F01_bin.56]